MHMSDALLSPAVGAAFWAASAGLVAVAARRCKDGAEEATVPLMGVLGAFVFAAQMINFSIPGTGSSGHLGGGLLLAIVLGPHRAFLSIASILLIQCLFFADGGLMALGANLFNLGFLACYLAYPLVWKPLANSGGRRTPGRLLAATMSAAILAFLLGAGGIVAQTSLSGLSDLSPAALALFLLPVQALLGAVEGLVTAGILGFLLKTRPELLGWTSINGADGADGADASTDRPAPSGKVPAQGGPAAVEAIR